MSLMSKLSAILLLLFSPLPAFACSCMAPSLPDVAYDQATAVFTANIHVIRRGTGGGILELRFTRRQTWKGEVPLEFSPRQDGCSIQDVQDGAEYLVYAMDDMAINMCTRRKLLQRAKIEASYLDELKASRRKDLVAHLLESLRGTPDENALAEAVELAGEILRHDRAGTSRSALMPVILQGATHASATVRLESIQALSIYRLSGGADVLVAALKDPDRSVREAAVGSLGMVLRADSAMFQSLVSALKLARENPNPDRAQQETLLSSFARALPGSAATEREKAEAVVLMRGLIDEIRESWKRVAPVQHLGMMGSRARGAAPHLLQVLKAADDYLLKQYTIIALGDVGAVDMQPEIEPYLKDRQCYVVAAVVKAVWKMNKEGFRAFFVERGMPEMKSRFDECATQFVFGLEEIAPVVREMESFVADKYATMPDSDPMKVRVKSLLDRWKSAP